MSYYTYFKVPAGYRSKGASLQDIKWGFESIKETIFNYKLNLLSVMIQAFYKNNYSAIKVAFLVWLDSVKKERDLKVALEYFDGDDNAAFNHAEANSEYELEEFINNYNNLLNIYLEELVVLSNIKPEENVQEYLRYDYVNAINTILKNAQEAVADISLRQLWLDCYNTKRTEDGN